jgi:hypothetical protein
MLGKRHCNAASFRVLRKLAVIFCNYRNARAVNRCCRSGLSQTEFRFQNGRGAVVARRLTRAFEPIEELTTRTKHNNDEDIHL